MSDIVLTFEGHTVRVVMRDGEPWWVLADICVVLEIVNAPDAATRLDDDEKDTIAISDRTPGNPNLIIVSEPGLYKLLQTSRKPEARRFDRLVRHEVLPSIRKYRCYPPPGTQLAPSHDPIQLDMVRQMLAPMAENIVQMRSSIDRIENRLAGGKQRFPKDVQFIFQKVIEIYYHGQCPCGCGTIIVRNGEQVPGVYSIDHWKGRNHTGITDGWPVAQLCNQRFYNDARFKDSKCDYFTAFQKTLERYLKQTIADAKQEEPTKVLEYRKPKQIVWSF